MKSVLFDVDGTLLNTHEFIASAFEHATRSVGQSYVRADIEKFMSTGRSLRATYADILPDEDTELLARTHHEYQMSNVHLAQPFSGAHDVLKALRDAGFRLAVVTNRGRVSALRTLDHNGLTDYFDVHICPEDTARTKPDPEHIFTALRALGLETQHSFMVGDTHADINAAHAANVRSIGISHSGNDGVLKYRPTFFVRSLPEILPIVLN